MAFRGLVKKLLKLLTVLVVMVMVGMRVLWGQVALFLLFRRRFYLILCFWMVLLVLLAGVAMVISFLGVVAALISGVFLDAGCMLVVARVE